MLFRNESLLIGVGADLHSKPLLDKLRRQLAPHGGAAQSTHGNTLRLDLCPGHAIVIRHAHTDVAARPWLAHADGRAFSFLNVELIVPGCHDSFGGALGQTFKCKYEFGGEPFVFDRGTEEAFRVATLFTPTDQFSPNATCI